MRHSFHFLAAALTIGTLAVRAADFKVIANPGIKVNEVSASDLKDIFLATKTLLSDGTHVEPVWEKGGATHEEFLKEYVGKTDAAVANYFRSLVFTGRGSMPKSLPTDSDVVSYVERTKGAIGYVAASTNAGETKVLQIK